MWKCKNYHYIQPFDAKMFGMAEARADEYWKYRRMSIQNRRIAMYQERLHLLNLPWLSLDQTARLEELNSEWKRLQPCSEEG